MADIKQAAKWASEGNSVTSERFKDKSGEWQDRTEWHTLVAYARTAEIVRDYVQKGSKLYVEGRLQTRSWDDKDGRKVYRTEIIVTDIALLSGREERQTEPARRDDFGSQEVDMDDVPF